MYAPFRARHELVEVFPTLLAKVLIGASSFVHDADTPAVLPDFTNIALDEKSTCIVILNVRLRQR